LGCSRIETAKRFVNVHRQQPDNWISKMLTLTPPGKFMRMPTMMRHVHWNNASSTKSVGYRHYKPWKLKTSKMHMNFTENRFVSGSVNREMFTERFFF